MHPLIHAGILAMRDNPDHMRQVQELGVTLVDVVAINLYPFKQTILKEGVKFEDALENIDIGGPTMIRAAAKNWQDVAVVVDPQDYQTVLDELKGGEVSRDTKRLLAYKVFEHTASYDALISGYLRSQLELSFPTVYTPTFEKVQDLRYGENPHQSAVFYKEIGHFDGTLAAAEQLHGKELSYNNINDANGALDLVKEFDQPCAVAVKHANPCGVAVGKTILEAYQNAYAADPVSIYGGIVALNRECDAATAAELAKIFLEIIIAPSFSEEALAILTQKKNIRLLKLPQLSKRNTPDMLDYKKVAGGLPGAAAGLRALQRGGSQGGYTARALGSGDGGAALCHDCGQAYQIQRHRAGQRKCHRGRRAGADQPHHCAGACNQIWRQSRSGLRYGLRCILSL